MTIENDADRNKESLRRAGFKEKEGRMTFVIPHELMVVISEFFVESMPHNKFVQHMNSLLKGRRVDYTPKHEGRVYGPKDTLPAKFAKT